MSNRVLVINCGSSSMKYQLLDTTSGRPLAVGLVERIGTPAGQAKHSPADGDPIEFGGSIPDHESAVAIMRRLFAASGTSLDSPVLAAVGHRVVHGGPVFTDPIRVTPHVLQQIRELSELAPLHNPANAIGIEQAMAAFPDVPQVAVFDTAFFAGLPAASATYALDRGLAERYQVRRYGFHGTSHRYVSDQAARFLGGDPAMMRQIVLHLGNGASASAILGGRPLDTSMGFTPLEGLVMGTRSGDLDPGLLIHLLRQGVSPDELDTVLNRRSGVLGLSGVSDFRDLTERVEAGDADAGLALDVYCHRIRKYIGAYLAVLGGADVITFTAGVGENSPVVRSRSLSGLSGLGIELDHERNAVRTRGPRVISTDSSAVTVLVVPTNEELAIARDAVALVAGRAVSRAAPGSRE